MATKKIKITEALVYRTIAKVLRENEEIGEYMQDIMQGEQNEDFAKLREMIQPIAEQVDKLQEEFQEIVNFFGEGNEQLDNIAANFMDLNEALHSFGENEGEVGSIDEEPNRFSTHYGSNANNNELAFTLKRVRAFCEKHGLNYQTLGAFCGSCKFDRINIYEDGFNAQTGIDASAKPECVATVSGDKASGEVKMQCRGEEFSSVDDFIKALRTL